MRIRLEPESKPRPLSASTPIKKIPNQCLKPLYKQKCSSYSSRASDAGPDRRIRIRVIKSRGSGSGFRIYLVPVTYTVNVQKHAMAKNWIYSFLSYIRYCMYKHKYIFWKFEFLGKFFFKLDFFSWNPDMYYNSYGSASLLIKQLLDPEELIEYCVCVAPLPGPSLFGGLDDGQTQSTQPEHGHCRTRLHLSKCTIC